MDGRMPPLLQSLTQEEEPVAHSLSRNEQRARAASGTSQPGVCGMDAVNRIPLLLLMLWQTRRRR